MIKCVITLAGSILVGELKSIMDDEMNLTNPREIQVAQVGPNQTKFTILNIFGKPNEIVIQLGNITLYYTLEDPNVLTLYNEHVSNIHRPRPGEIDLLVNKNRH